MITLNEVWKALHDVKDPEIPILSLVDLGVITEVKVENDCVFVSITPTFIGCPAIEVMRSEVQRRIEKMKPNSVEVTVNLNKSWDSNKITDTGRIALLKFGLAPPPRYENEFDLDILEHAACPYCNSNDTTLQTPFGPTLCRSIHYCNTCMQAFEQFKPI